MSRRGFTLVELCVVVSIIGMIASVCWPAMRQYANQLSLRASVRELSRKFHAAREQAVLTGTPQVISGAVFYPDGSAERFQMELGPKTGRRIEIHVEENGRIFVG